MKDDSSKSMGNSPLAALHHLEFILQQKSDQLLRQEVGIGFGQLRIMEGLSQTVASTQRALASKLHQTEANISRQTRLLAEKGLVEISKDAKNKRQRRVKLSSNGNEAVGKANTLLSELHKETLAKLDYRDAYNFTEVAQKLAAKF